MHLLGSSNSLPNYAINMHRVLINDLHGMVRWLLPVLAGSLAVVAELLRQPLLREAANEKLVPHRFGSPSAYDARRDFPCLHPNLIALVGLVRVVGDGDIKWAVDAVLSLAHHTPCMKLAAVPLCWGTAAMPSA